MPSAAETSTRDGRDAVLRDDMAVGLEAFSERRPLLLVTGFPPDAAGGGAVIVRSLLTEEDRRRIVWATLAPTAHGHDAGVVSLAGSGGRSILRDGTVRTGFLRRALQQLIDERSCSAAWVVSDGVTTRMLPGILASGVPTHVSVHDDPAWGWAALTRRYAVLAPLFARDFRRSLPAARSIDVVSVAMGERYGRYDVTTRIVHRGLATTVAPAPTYDVAAGLSVAVLGSTYGLRELEVLVAALGKAGTRLQVPTRLTVIGESDRKALERMCPHSVTLDCPGHLDEATGIARLRSSFLLYLSYPFRRRGRILRTTSFPTKLSTYVMAARPLLLHMPVDSSVAGLDEGSSYATLWASTDVDEGAALLERLWRRERTAFSFHQEADATRRAHFSYEKNRARLLAALNALPIES